MKRKLKNETFSSYIKRIIKNIQNNKIYIGARKEENLLLVNQNIFDRYMKNKRYDMKYEGNNRITLDINPNGEYKFCSQNIYIPNNIKRSNLPNIGEAIEVNIEYRWYDDKRTIK